MQQTLKTYRELNQLTQQELAKQSGISLRTIQRIESGSSKGSAYVIKSLCKTLGIELSQLALSETEANTDEAIQVTQPQLNWINLSTILGLIFPGLNLLIPALLYRGFKDQINNQPLARKMLSFQAFWLIGTLIILFIVPPMVHAVMGMREYGSYPLFVWLYVACVCINLMVIIRTSILMQQSGMPLRAVPSLF